MDGDGWSLIWFAVPGVIIPGVLLFLAFRGPSSKQMTRWATQAQVTINPDNEAMIRRRLGRSRRYRSLLSAPFWWIPALPMIVWPLPGWMDRAVWIPLTGYVLGSMLAAVAKPEAPAEVRTAELTPRLPSRYAPPRSRVAPWLLLWTSLMLFGLTKAFPPQDPESVRRHLPLLAAAVIVAVLAEAALRTIANRPQAPGNPSCRAADDALRSTGATAAIASAVTLALIVFNSAITALLGTGHRAWLGVPAALLVTGLTYAVFLAIVTQQPWAPTGQLTVGDEPRPQPVPSAQQVDA